MLQQIGGAIVNISTFAAFEPDPDFPTSSVFRGGLAAYTKLFADKYAANNFRMNNILPGFIDSLPVQDEFRVRIPHAAIWEDRRDFRNCGFSRVRRRRVHYRAEYPR
jgi:NAD(P)-dependent dehydrogenase (short-subunit alcohol dehydrogenase family)